MSPIPLGIFAVSGAAVTNDAFDWLESTVATGSISSITFSNLNNYSAYKHLQIRISSRGSGTTGTGNSAINIRFNGDTASNYSYHQLRGDGSAVNTEGVASATFVSLEEAQPQGGSTADVWGCVILDILNFNSTTRKKTVRSMHGSYVAADLDLYQTSGFWNNTAALTSVTLNPVNSFRIGTRVSLYGIKG